MRGTPPAGTTDMRDLLVHPKIHLAEIEERIEKSLLRALRRGGRAALGAPGPVVTPYVYGIRTFLTLKTRSR